MDMIDLQEPEVEAIKMGLCLYLGLKAYPDLCQEVCAMVEALGPTPSKEATEYVSAEIITKVYFTLDAVYGGPDGWGAEK